MQIKSRGGVVDIITLDEIIIYSKQKENPPVTVIDEVTQEELEYVRTVAERLRLNILEIKDTKMVVVINHIEVATKLARDINRRSQVMYYDFVKRPIVNFAMYAMAGNTPSWVVIRDNGYIVKSYSADGEETDQWLNTDIEDTKAPTLDGINKYTVSLKIRGCGNSKRCNSTILDLSRYYFINDGKFNKERQCYYPKDVTSKKGIAEYNRLEKLFKRWGFRSL